MKILRVLLVSACFAMGVAQAADKTCTKSDAANAAKSLERANNWNQLYKSWQDYRHCDTGSVADDYTESLMRLFVEWKSAETLAAAMQKDAQFKEWILARLKSPAAKDDADAIYSRVRVSCPKGLDAFCSELADSVKSAK